MQRVTGRSLHLRLKFACSDWPSPLVSHQLRFAQILFDFSFDLRLRNHRIKRWLGRTVFLGPNPMSPIDFFDRSLIRYTLCKCQCSIGTLVWRRGTGENKSQCRDSYPQQTHDARAKKTVDYENFFARIFLDCEAFAA